MLTNEFLLTRLNAFELDDARATFKFSDRLAHENGWSRAFARGAIEEYKKFLYLASISNVPATPSDIVDQVWHLHLTFTRSYWADLCQGVLGRPLHHGPTKGGAAEDAKYVDQYERTLALYRTEFGAEPPPQFWPDRHKRFSSAPHQRWVDRRSHFVVPKLSGYAWSVVVIAATTIGIANTVALGSTIPQPEEFPDWMTQTNLMLWVLLPVALFLLLSLPFKTSPKRKQRKSNGGCDGSTVALGAASASGGKSKPNEGGEKGDGSEGSGGEGGSDGGGDGGGGCGGGCGSS